MRINTGVRSSQRTDALQLYDRLGLVTFPYDYEDRPFKGWPNPGMMKGFDDLTPVVRTFGVLLGSGYVVIDVDADRGGDLAELEHRFGPLPPTMTVITPSGDGRNLHLYFRVSEPLRGSSALKETFPGIDFLGEGQNVKGATSGRVTGDGEQEIIQTYNIQHPVLEPAALPAELERAWRMTTPTKDDPPPIPPKSAKLDGQEKNYVRKSIRYSLSLIREAGPGRRHDVLFRQASAIYQNAALLSEDPSAYDDKIRTAYLTSGGEDYRDLEKQVKATKAWAANNPKPRPAFSIRYPKVNVPVAQWADAAMQSCGKRQAQKRELIKVIAHEVDKDYRLTKAGELLAEIAGIPQPKASEYLTGLADDGFLDRTGGLYSLNERWIPHFSLCYK